MKTKQQKEIIDATRNEGVNVKSHVFYDKNTLKFGYILIFI